MELTCTIAAQFMVINPIYMAREKTRMFVNKSSKPFKSEKNFFIWLRTRVSLFLLKTNLRRNKVAQKFFFLKVHYAFL